MNEETKTGKASEGQMKDLAGKALKLVVVNYASRFLGLVRTIVLVAVFGASSDVDIFYGTFGAVLIFFEIIPFAFNQAFVPIYTKFLVDKDNRGMGEISLSFLWTGAVIFGILIVVFSTMSTGIVKAIYHFGEAGEAGEQLGELLFRYSLLVMLINYFIGNFSALLYARERVVVPALINLLKNIVIIASILMLHKEFGVISIAMGFAFGCAVQMFYLFWMAIKSGWRAFLPKKIPFGQIGYMWRLLIPAFLGLAVAQVNIVIDRYFTSGLERPGEVTVLSLANILISLITVFTSSLTIAIFPKFSSQVTKMEIDELKDMLNRALRALFFFVIPIMALVILISSPLVYTIYNIGKLKGDLNSLELIQSLFRVFCIWVIFFSVNYQLFLVFFSFKDTFTPMCVSAFNVGCNVLFNWLFTTVLNFGVHGIVYSTALSVAITTALILVLIYPRVGKILDLRLLKGIARIIVSCVPMAAVVLLFNVISRVGWVYQSEGVVVKDLVYLGVSVLFGLIAYGWASLIFNRDMTLYFTHNWRTFLGVSSR